MKLLLKLSFILFVAAACSSPSKGKKQAEESKVAKEEVKNVRLSECKSNSDVRSLEIVEGEGSTFDLKYTKFGDAKTIATGSREHCEKIRDRVKKNLESAGFTCS